MGPQRLGEGVVSFGWEGKRVLVVGDVMLDIYRRGRAVRLSPEAPVPIVLNPTDEYCLGGAANIAKNIATLRAKAILVGFAGKDEEGSRLRVLAEEGGIEVHFFPDRDRPTTAKTRIVGLPGHQQVCRIDREETAPLGEECRGAILASSRSLSEGVDMVIVSDYRKGVVFPGLVAEIARSGKRIVVDPKGPDVSLYRGAWAIVPNWGEAEELVGITDGGNVDWVGKSLCSASGCEWVIITRHGEGASVYSHDRIEHIPARAREVVDTTGAGDTFTAVFALGIAAGMEGSEAAKLANKAAGIVVGKRGTAHVEWEELRSE